MSIDAKRHAAAAAFLALLALSVFWPAPVIAVNDVCCHARLDIDNLSFLGREAPRWDVAFWCIAGVLALALVQAYFAGGAAGATQRPVLNVGAGGLAGTFRRIDAFLAVLAALLVALIWRFADAPVTAWAERIQSDDVQDTIRIANRFGGGMNPAMVVVFFLLAGLAYRHERWIRYAAAMTVSGAAAGVVVQIVKFAAGRTRPELWLGPFHHIGPKATSFPSGHTVGAFALAGVLMFASPSRSMRVAAFLLAVSVAVSRVLAFRHWTSDVVASAAIGTLIAMIVTRWVTPLETTRNSP